MNLQEKFVGSLIGLGLGDAIGEISQFDDRLFDNKQTLEEVVEEEFELVYSDDTEMAIGLAESILIDGDVITEHIGSIFKQNLNSNGRMRAYGYGTVMSMGHVVIDKCKWENSDREVFADGSYGNGSAMRIAPVACFYYDNKNLYDKVKKSSVATHSHSFAIDGAAVLAKAISMVIPLDPENNAIDAFAFCDTLISFSRTKMIRDKMKLVKKMLGSKLTDAEIVLQLGLSLTVHESMPHAIYAFLKYNTSFKDCLDCAVKLGGDADTVGAMACSISGAYLGIKNLPKDLYSKLEDGNYLIRLGKMLANKKEF